MKIPIKYAINSGAWFQCKTGSYDFRLRINSFEKLILKDTIELAKIDPKFDLIQGDFWILKIEIVNFNKKTISGNEITHEILIIDYEDFEYSDAFDSHLCCDDDSYCIQSSGLKHLGICDTFYPKIKYAGFLLYFIPDDDNAEFFVAIKEGNIQEI